MKKSRHPGDLDDSLRYDSKSKRKDVYVAKSKKTPKSKILESKPANSKVSKMSNSQKIIQKNIRKKLELFPDKLYVLDVIKNIIFEIKTSKIMIFNEKNKVIK